MNVQNLKPTACYHIVVDGPESAKQTLRIIVKYLGTGFHPDTCGMDYVTNEGKPTFEKFEAEIFDLNMLKIIEHLDDVYSEAIELWHEFGMIDNEQYNNLTGDVMTTTKLDYSAEMDKLIKHMNDFIGKKIDEDKDDCFCAALTKDITCGDSVSIRFMEEDGSPEVMDLLEELAIYLFESTGRHYCISNNSPTDGHALVFVDPAMDEEYNKHQFADEFKAGFDVWLKDPDSFSNRPYLHIVYQTLDDYLDRTCDGIVNWKDHLKYNEEMWYQVMMWNRYDY